MGAEICDRCFARRDKRPAPGGGNPAGSSGVLYWLRQDFRLHDNPALCAAAQAAKRGGGKLTLVYVHSPEEDGDDLETGALIWSLLAALPSACTHAWANRGIPVGLRCALLPFC